MEELFAVSTTLSPGGRSILFRFMVFLGDPRSAGGVLKGETDVRPFSYRLSSDDGGLGPDPPAPLRTGRRQENWADPGP
jgi:hypothetical protein